MSRNIESHGMRDSTVAESSATGAWDPYDIWLNRVKKPRDQQTETTQAVTAQTVTTQTIKVAGSDLSETGRFRALNPSLSG